MTARSILSWTFLMLASLTLAGCKEVLYSNLTEASANEMVAHLDAAGIPATRRSDKDRVYVIMVEAAYVPAAITVLGNEGLPHKTFETIGTVFDAEGIVGTPFEERARFTFAMNEELAQTISSISGVRSARVHVMLPPTTRFERAAAPSSASVTINYEDNFDAPRHVPTIKNLVSHAVPDLAYDNVAVALFPIATLVPTPVIRPTAVVRIGSVTLPDSLPDLIALGIAGSLLAIFGPLWLLRRRGRTG